MRARMFKGECLPGELSPYEIFGTYSHVPSGAPKAFSQTPHSPPTLSPPSPARPAAPDSEEVVRVAKSKQDRAWDDIRECVTKIRNSMKTQDWSSCEEHWKECCRKMETSKKRIQEKGIPPFYIKLLVGMEDTLNALNKEALRKMKAAVGKAAANLKTIIKKHNVAYATDIAECRENPSKYESDAGSDDGSDDESDSESDSDSDSDDDEKPAPKKAAPAAKAKAPKVSPACALGDACGSSTPARPSVCRVGCTCLVR